MFVELSNEIFYFNTDIRSVTDGCSRHYHNLFEIYYMKEGNCSYFIDNKVYEITSGDIVLIPDGVKKIGASAFNGCEKLDGIVIPESVTEIGDRAFSASGILYARVGAKIKKIGKNAFSLCDNFENFYYAGTLSQWREVECDGTWSDENGVFHCADIEFPISDLYE